MERFYTKHRLTYNQEVVEGDVVRCTARLVGFDEKRIHHYYEMYHASDGYLASTCEFLSLHVDLSARRVTPLPGLIVDRLKDLLVVHEKMPPCDNIGRVIKQPVAPTL